MHVDSEVFARIASLILTIALATLLTGLILVVPGRRLRRLAFASLLLLLSGVVTLHFLHVSVFGTLLNVSAIDSIMSTSFGEAFEFLPYLTGYGAALLLIFWGSFLVVLLRFVRPTIGGDSVGGWRVVGIGFLILVPFIAMGTYSSRFGEGNPPLLRVLRSLTGGDLMVRSAMLYRQYVAERRLLAELVEKRSALDVRASRSDERRLTAVIVLGESAARKHHSIFGYEFRTTPQLESLGAEVLPFGSATSPAATTQESVVRIMTYASNDNGSHWITSPSLIDEAEAAGYSTFWLSNQAHLSRYDTKVSAIAREADRFTTINTGLRTISDDMRLMPLLREVLAGEEPAKLIVLHLMGSHNEYVNRYPASEAVFEPADYRRTGEYAHFSEPALRRLAEYDNSILHTDRFIGQAIELLRSEPNGLLVYLADHGELVDGDTSRYGHGDPDVRRDHVDVPFAIWQEEHSWAEHGLSPAQRLAVSNRPVGMEDFVHTAVKLLGIESDRYDPTRDVLSAKYLERDRLVYSPEGELLEYEDLR